MDRRVVAICMMSPLLPLASCVDFSIKSLVRVSKVQTKKIHSKLYMIAVEQSRHFVKMMSLQCDLCENQLD